MPIGRPALALLLAAGIISGIFSARFAEAADGFRAVDGDTLEVLSTGERIRLMGVDTPELHRPGCEAEARAALVAKLAVQHVLDRASAVEIRREGADRYGRTLARVYLDGDDLSAALVSAGMGRAYDGGRRQGWC